MSSIDRLKRTLNEADFRANDPRSIVERFAEKHDARVLQGRSGRYILKPRRYSIKEFFLDENDRDSVYVLRNRLVERITGFAEVSMLGDGIAAYIPVMPKFDAETFSIKGAKSIMGLSKVWKPYGGDGDLFIYKCALRNLSELNLLKFQLTSLTVSDCTLGALSCDKLTVDEMAKFKFIDGLQNLSGLPRAEGIELSHISVDRIRTNDFINKTTYLEVHNVRAFDYSKASALKEMGITVIVYDEDGNPKSFRPGWEPV